MKMKMRGISPKNHKRKVTNGVQVFYFALQKQKPFLVHI